MVSADTSTVAPAAHNESIKAIIEYLLEHPMNLISENSLKNYFQAVYTYSKEITKASKDENEQSLKKLIDTPIFESTVIDNTTGGLPAAATTTTSVSPANSTDGPTTTTGVPAVIDPTATAANPAAPTAGKGGKYTRKKSRKPNSKISKSYKYRVRL